MTHEKQCTKVGLTPARVVQCAEGSNTEGWYAATMIAEDGLMPRTVTQDDIPSSLTWVRRSMV